MKENYLSTGDSMYVTDVLEPLADTDLLLVLIAIRPRHQSTGLLEEQNVWIHTFWSAMLESKEDFVGCRTTWNAVFYAVEKSKGEVFEELISSLLKKSRSDDLRSVCVTMMVSGDMEKKLRLFDDMQAEVASELNFNTIKNINSRFVDGELLSHLFGNR